VARYLVLGDPVVALGPAALIPDGALIVEGAEITAAGRREALAARGPFDRVLGSAGHFVMPGFVNCHYHSELAIGPGLYQHVFEKANVHIQGAVGPVDEQDLYDGILWGLVTAIKGGQTGTVDMYYGRGRRARLPAASRGAALGRAGRTGRAVPRAAVPALVRRPGRAGPRLQRPPRSPRRAGRRPRC
jgi:cytosine/adenosine deaminase-related metal-dependent hydrolase